MQRMPIGPTGAAMERPMAQPFRKGKSTTICNCCVTEGKSRPDGAFCADLTKFFWRRCECCEILPYRGVGEAPTPSGLKTGSSENRFFVCCCPADRRQCS